MQTFRAPFAALESPALADVFEVGVLSDRHHFLEAQVHTVGLFAERPCGLAFLPRFLGRRFGLLARAFLRPRIRLFEARGFAGKRLADWRIAEPDLVTIASDGGEFDVNVNAVLVEVQARRRDGSIRTGLLDQVEHFACPPFHVAQSPDFGRVVIAFIRVRVDVVAQHPQVENEVDAFRRPLPAGRASIEGGPHRARSLFGGEDGVVDQRHPSR